MAMTSWEGRRLYLDKRPHKEKTGRHRVEAVAVLKVVKRRHEATRATKDAVGYDAGVVGLAHEPNAIDSNVLREVRRQRRARRYVGWLERQAYTADRLAIVVDHHGFPRLVVRREEPRRKDRVLVVRNQQEGRAEGKHGDEQHESSGHMHRTSALLSAQWPWAQWRSYVACVPCAPSSPCHVGSNAATRK